MLQPNTNRPDFASMEVGKAVLNACTAEVMTPKVGNVHLLASFEQVTWMDFVVSAMAIAPILQQAAQSYHEDDAFSLGDTILQAVEATHDAVGHNTNLGIILLLAPLCVCPLNKPWQQGVKDVLQSLDAHDAKQIYKAIALANPGGLGKVPHADVHDQPADDILKAMALAADRDQIARQYVNGFEDVFNVVLPGLIEKRDQGLALDQVIVQTQLMLLAREPDSLIARKAGLSIALQAQQKAKAVCLGQYAIEDFDRWLRSDGHKRNPGTTADMLAAGLYIAFIQSDLAFPAKWSPPAEL